MIESDKVALEAFAQRDNEGVMYSMSLQIVLYAKLPLAELCDGAIACYEYFLGTFDSEKRWYHTGSMKHFRQFTGKYVDIYSTLCLAADSHLPSFRIFDSDGAEDFRPPVFETGHYGPFSWLQFQLPAELAHDWDGVLHMLTATAVPFPFRYGTVGYSLCWNRLSANRNHTVLHKSRCRHTHRNGEYLMTDDWTPEYASEAQALAIVPGGWTMHRCIHCFDEPAAEGGTR